MFVFSQVYGSLAREYVVDTQHPQASDENSGTAKLPFKTISKAAQASQAGDTVIVKAGVYREAVRLQNSGTSQAPISFIAEPNGSVVITGADVMDGWEKTPRDAPIYRSPWNHKFVIDRCQDGTLIEHHPESAPLWGRAEQIIVDGAQLLPAENLDELVKAWNRHHDAIKNNLPSPVLQSPLTNLGGPFGGMFFANTAKKVLYIWLADGSHPKEHHVEASTRGLLFGVNPWTNPKGIEYVHVHGFVFRYGATFPQRPAVWLHGKHNLMEDCVVEEMAGSGVSVSGTMRRCVVRRCGHTGGGAVGDNFLNEECLWEGNSWKPISRNWEAGGFKITRTNGGVFRRCVFRGNGGPGLWLDIHVRNVLITECVFQENEKSGLFIEISRDITVERNLAVGNGTGIVGKVSEGDWSVGGIQIAEGQNCIVAFNTCVGNKDGITFREQGPRRLYTEDFGEVQYHNRNNVVFGNVCAYNKGYQLALWYDNYFFGWHPADRMKKFCTIEEYENYLKTISDELYDPTKKHIVIDHNLYYSTSNQPLILYGAPWRPKHQVFRDLDSFVENTGFDAHSQVAKPQFVDVEAVNYRFQSTSPAWTMQVGWLNVPVSVDDLFPPLLSSSLNLQPDPTWAGGLTEMTKICALASAHGIPVIPHHGGIASTHLIASQTTTTCPIQEWLLQAGARDNVFMKHKIEPVNGYIELPRRPGLGIELLFSFNFSPSRA